MIKFKILKLIFIIIIFVSCEAPHNNPLDPYNTNTELAKLNGKVYTESLPIEPITNALLIWRNTGESILTDAEGNFNFEFRKRKDGFLICRKDNYFTDSVYIKWGNSNSISKNIYLNMSPSILSFNMKSSVLFFSDTNYTEVLISELKINDRDNDIDSLFLINRDLNFRTSLNFNSSLKTWQKTLTPYEFGVSSLDELIGKKFTVIVYEKNNRFCELEGGNLTRLISQMPQTLSPRDDEIIELPSRFSWQSFPAGFDFNYQIQIFKNVIPTQLAFEEKDIPKDSTGYTLNASLQQGNYYWMLFVIDEYGNKVRSKPVLFKIQN